MQWPFPCPCASTCRGNLIWIGLLPILASCLKTCSCVESGIGIRCCCTSGIGRTLPVCHSICVWLDIGRLSFQFQMGCWCSFEMCERGFGRQVKHGNRSWRVVGPWMGLVPLFERGKDVVCLGGGFWRMKMIELQLVLRELTLVNRAERQMVWNRLACG